jgi:hypothetical protein
MGTPGSVASPRTYGTRNTRLRGAGALPLLIAPGSLRDRRDSSVPSSPRPVRPLKSKFLSVLLLAAGLLGTIGEARAQLGHYETETTYCSCGGRLRYCGACHGTGVVIRQKWVWDKQPIQPSSGRIDQGMRPVWGVCPTCNGSGKEPRRQGLGPLGGDGRGLRRLGEINGGGTCHECGGAGKRLYLIPTGEP